MTLIDPGGRLEEHHFVDRIDAPHHIAFRWNAVDGTPDQPFAVGEKEVTITDLGRRRRIDVLQRPRAHPWRALVMNWIDDSFGRLGDSRLADLENRGGDALPSAAIGDGVTA